MGTGRIELRALTADNFDAVIALEVAEHQQPFLYSNVESIAWAYVAPECRTQVIYEDENAVGFATYGYVPADGRCWIIHLMVDERMQRRGVGRAALGLLLARMSEESAQGDLLVAVDPDNVAALGLYGAFGFQDTGRRQNGELILRRPGGHDSAGDQARG